MNMAKSPEEMAQSMIENLKEKTGKSLEEWITGLRETGLGKHKEMMSHLKGDHGLTHGYANLIAIKALKSDAGSAESDEDLINAQYSGLKGDLRPIYNAIIAKVTAFGSDVEIAPKKAYVSLRRHKQFAIVQPSTKTRVDVGINLKDADVTKRLEASGSFNAMVSHRVRLSSADEVDAELLGWLHQAYEES
jgi:predicted transport protein